MLPFKKEHNILICIDSDGTIMDTMTIKHVKCFGPSFVDVFKINNNREDILKHWNDTNLYTRTRGINRFQGLKEILEYIDSKYDIKFDGVEKFYNFVNTTKAFSVSLLKEELAKYPDNFVIKKAIEWSDEVNKRISSLPESKIFDNCKETLIKLSEVCDLVGVSSANKSAVIEEWTRNDIIKYFKFVACQDVGSKSYIISEAIKNGYNVNNVIMLGDALGDYKAAKENSCLFYPLIPSRESEGWKKLESLIDVIKNGEFIKREEKYIKEFKDFLGD